MKLSLTKMNLNLGNNPRKDWVMTLCLMLIAGVIAVYGAVTLFIHVNSSAGNVSADDVSTSTSATLKLTDVTKITNAFSKRDADFETIRRTPYTKTVDPSK